MKTAPQGLIDGSTLSVKLKWFSLLSRISLMLSLLCLCFQQTGELCLEQQKADATSGHVNNNRTFSSSLSQPAGDADKGQPPVFAHTEPLSSIQKQDMAATSSFSVPADSLLQPGSQQFLLEPREALRQERPSSGSGAVGRLCGEPAAQQQQLPLFPPDEVAQLEEAVRHLKAKGFCNLPLQSESSLAKQHQQQIQKQQIQQQQLQQQQVLENLQQQLFQSQIQMQCGIFQDASQSKSAEQQGSAQGVVPNQSALFQQAQQQQQAALFQQATDILSIQTNFLQQTSSHPSPPMFHNPTSLSETQDPQGLFQKSSQDRVQATLFQNTMTVLQSPDQQPSTPGMFLPQTSLPSQLTTSSAQQQQLAFLGALQTPTPEPQSVFQAQTQIPQIQQRSPLKQQQPSQPQLHSQTPQQASLFPNISPHTPANTLSPGQQQPQQASLMFCNSPLSTPDQTSSLLFSSPGQIPPLTSSSLVAQDSSSLLFSQANMVTVHQQDRSEPMTLGNPSAPPQQVMFQEQQPMQVGSGSNSRQEQPVGLFMSQSNMASLQGGLSQELAQSHLFNTQNGVTNLQTTTSSPVQQPGPLFQTAVSGSMSQPTQPQQSGGLFLFGIQDGEK